MCRANPSSSTSSHQTAGAEKDRMLKTNVGSTSDPDKYLTAPSTAYSWTQPENNRTRPMDHFSSLLFGGSIVNTTLEVVLLTLPFVVLTIYGSGVVNVKGSMPFQELAIFFVVCSMFRRVYNAYLEAVYFGFPSLRTQPVREHRLKQKKDLMGRDLKQVEVLDKHDKWTMISQFIMHFGIYYAIPGFYPGAVGEGQEEQTYQERFLRLILNHYVMSFGMYWAHRSCHAVPYLWKNIHSIHHYSKHPLSRNTYEDHWLDNFANAIIGHIYAQILIPLDRPTFWFSHLFRIMESLEKHSGISCGFNLAHSIQRFLPFAQMPHHHDWHHEGFKGSNYTFSSIGGLWDCIFGTRKAGRYRANMSLAATREDLSHEYSKIRMNQMQNLSSKFNPLLPLVGLTMVVGHRLFVS